MKAMTSRTSASNPKSKSQRGSGEPELTKTPRSARVTNNLSGDKGHRLSEQHKSPNTPSAAERRSSNGRNSELQQVYETLGKTKDQLASAEEAKAEALEELAHTKALTEELSIKLNEMEEASERERSRAREIEQASFTAAEDWQAELEAIKKQYEEQVNDLCSAKQERESLKQELLASIDAKNEAVKLAGEAMVAAEASAKKVEELTADLMAAKSSLITAESTSNEVHELVAELAAAKGRLAEAHSTNEKVAKEGVAIVATRDASIREMFEAVQHAKAEIEILKHELVLAKDLELEIEDKQETMENLRFELAVAKDLGSKSSSAVAEAHSELVKANLELEQAKMAETESLASLASVEAELEKTQDDLRHKSEEATILAAALDSMHHQLENTEMKLADMKNRVLNADAKVSDLTKELHHFQKQLTDAVGAEEEARSTIQSLSISLHDLRLESEQAKQELLSAKAEAEREGEKAVAARAEVQTSKRKSHTAREMLVKAKAATKLALAESREAKMDAAGIRAEAETARHEAERAKEETERARREADIAKEKVFTSLKELQFAQNEVQKAQAQVQIERKQSSFAREESQEALSSIMELEAHLRKAQAKVKEAVAAANDVSNKLEGALREKEIAKETSDSTVDLGKKEVSDTWETARNEPVVAITISQEEYDNMKLKVHEAEAYVDAIMADIAAIKADKGELSQKLELVYKEMEVNKLETLQAQQQLDNAEKAKSDLEAELQKLRLNFKQQQNCADMVPKSPLDSGIIGSPKLEFSEEELQLDELQNTDILALQKDDSHNERALTLSSKKKKKATLLKIASYLSKTKKH